MKLETRIGIFFTAAVAVVGLLIFRTEKLELGGKKDSVTRFTYFDQVAGLNPQSKIRVAGVPVGEVEK
ncbi:MAG: MCE family protein, partial [Acidobacteriota bacterium]|nr:MCE family protein [Acidobacteriota bacterium]